ncbi:MAG: Lrp/AsnC family transcriptional regulator [Caldilineales bacterium]|nr:Lrp/AsnC family transcriptional regulator [Caldilineales bacterium]
MDQLDRSILAILQQDGRTPYTEIAQRLEISEGTARNRVARLMEKGALQIVGMIDPYQLGFDAPALIGVSVQGANLEDVAACIAHFPEVSYLVMVSGEFDLIVEVLCRDREHLATFLNQQLRKTPGVFRTQTFMILETYKMSYGAQPRLPHPPMTGAAAGQGAAT